MDTTRRRFLKTVGAVGVGGAVLSTPAAGEHFDHQPDSVTLTYDEDVLNDYRPELVLSDDARPKFNGLYGWTATSPDYDTDAHVFWAEYSHQEGLSPFWGALTDSHYGDHEPLVVFSDSDSGEVEWLVASTYHWTAGKVSGEDASMNGTHPHLRAIDPWHQFTAADRSGTFPEVHDLTQEFDSWLANGMEDPLEPGVVVNPWRMLDRDDWWRDEGVLINTDRLIVSAFKPFSDSVGTLEG